MPYETIAGHRLYYEWQGDHAADRETIVFLHDGLGAVGAWKDVPQRIAETVGCNALVLDRWGYGGSDPRPDFPFQFMEAEVPVLGEFLDALGIASAHLVGHSDGGSIALVFAALHPERVHTLVTEAAHTFVERETQAGIEELVRLQAEGKTPRWLYKLHGERADTLLTAWADGWLSDEHARWNIEGYLPDIRCPVLVVQGEQDQFGTLAQVRSITQRVAGAREWVVPQCGHTPHNEADPAFAERVVDFLREQGAGQAPATERPRSGAAG